MIIIVIDPGQENHQLLQNLPDECRVVPVAGTNLTEVWRHTPSVVAFLGHTAILQCRGGREQAGECCCRILIVLEPAAADAAIKGRMAGADGVLIGPSTEIFRHALANEHAAAARWRQAVAWIAASTELNHRYELRKVLGIGLRAIFFLAFDRREEREVTIKLLRKMLSDQAVLLREFHAEADMLRRVRSDAVVPLQGIDIWDDMPFLVFAFGEARNLYQLAATENFTETEILKIAYAIGCGLNAMKQQGMLHCDIKPENILFRDGQYYLSEFGLITPLEAPYDNSNFPYWGDAAFSSPEFFQSGATLNSRSDIYSLAMLLYTFIKSENPFYGYDYEESRRRRDLSDLLSFEHMTTAIGRPIQSLLFAMLDRRPEARPRLRELEIILQYALSMPTGKRPAASAPGSASSNPAISETPGATSGSSRRTGAAEGKPRPARIWGGRLKVGDTQELPARSLFVRYRTEIGAAVLIAVAFLTGLLLSRRPEYPGHFRQGELMTFTCYNGHTQTLRTLDFRTVKCPECHDPTSPSRTCTACGKVFGTSLWPERDMTEEECAAFEKKLRCCPYCNNPRIYPTPLIRASEPSKK